MHPNFIDKNYSEEGTISVHRGQVLNIYTACYSKAKDLSSLENILKNNPKQKPELGEVIDFTVETKRTPYATLPEITKHLPEFRMFLVHTLDDQARVLIHYKDGEYNLGKALD